MQAEAGTQLQQTHPAHCLDLALLVFFGQLVNCLSFFHMYTLADLSLQVSARAWDWWEGDQVLT